jgi:hypothetical protein
MKIYEPDPSLHGEEVILNYISGKVYIQMMGTLLLHASDFEVRLKNGQGAASFQYSEWENYNTETKALSAGFKGKRK